MSTIPAASLASQPPVAPAQPARPAPDPKAAAELTATAVAAQVGKQMTQAAAGQVSGLVIDFQV